MAGVTRVTNNDGSESYLDSQNRTIFTIDPTNGKIVMGATAFLDTSAAASILSLLAAGSITTAAIAANAVTAAKITTTMATPTIPLPLSGWRKVATNDVDVIANAGGILAKDTAPVFERVNLATDKSLRIKWAAASVVEIYFADNIPVPTDLDASQPLVVKLKAYMAGATNTPTIAVGYWAGVGGSDAGGATGALSNTAAIVSRSIAAPGTYPVGAAITLTPGSHGTDALYLVESFIEYTRK